MPISNELFAALEKGGALTSGKQSESGGGDPLFDRLLMQESGGRQFDKNGSVVMSGKGATGIAQVMPATAPEAAKLAGLEWDPERFRNDQEYNRRLGRAYFDKQLATFGDERMALAAYNAGPGATARAVARARQSGGDFLDYLPAETQKYVPAIMGGARVPSIMSASASSPSQSADTIKWMDERAIPRDDSRPGAQAKSAAVREGVSTGDLLKTFGASAVSGVGDMAQGLVGEPLAWLANKAVGTEEFEGKNLLSGVADAVREGMTEGGKLAREDSPSGDIFQPDTWKLPETTGGMLMIGADGLGSLIPSIVPFVGQAGKAAKLAKAAKAAELAGDAAKASELALQAERASRIARASGAVGGFGMTGGAAASEVRKNVEQNLQGRSHDDLIQTVPLYRDAFAQTGDAKMARQAVVNGAAQYATLFSGAMGAVGGGINAKLLEDVIVKRGVSAALGKVSGNVAVRGAVGAGAGAAGEGMQEVSEKVGQNAGENVGLGRPAMENVTRDSFGDFVGGAMVGGPMGAGGGGLSPHVSKPAQPAQPVVQPNSPLSNMASIGQSAQANAAQAQAASGIVPPEAQADPMADRLTAMQSFVEDKAFIQALRGTQGYGPESVTELLSAYAKARNPNLDPLTRKRAMSDLENFVQTFNNRPNFTFGQNTQERTQPAGTQVATVQQGAVGPTIRRPDGRTLDGEIITRPEGMSGANPNQLFAPPVLGLPTEEALAAKRQADADYDQAFQDLVKAEQLGATESELAEYQRTLMEAERLRDELSAQIADTDTRVADAQRRESESRRREILARVIEDGIAGVNPVSDVAGRFKAALMRQGYRDTEPTDAETQSIFRAVDVGNAREDGPLPSLPNEVDFYEPPKPPRAVAPKAEPQPKQQPARKLTPLEIRRYVAAGAVLNGDVLTLPDGTVIRLKGPQIAAAREAIRKATPQVEEASAKTEEVAPQSEEVAQQEPAPETFDVSTRTDDQIRYLAENGKPGWRESARAEIAKREQQKPEIRTPLDAAAHEAATSPLNDTPQPTDAQKEAGNYKVGRVKIQGMDISIENPQGSTRSGTSPDGSRWSNTLHSHYGYFTGTTAADGDHLDVFLTDGAEDAPVAWVIDQKNQDGSFDEHKIVLGPRAEEDARAAYLANYGHGWDGLGAISSMPIEAFKAWAFDGKKKRKPLVYVEPESAEAAPQPLTSTPFATFEQGASALKVLGDPEAIKERLAAAGIKHLPRKDGAAIPQKDAQEAARRVIPVRIDTYRVEGVPARLADVTAEVMESGEVRLLSPAGDSSAKDAATALREYADNYKDAPESVEQPTHQDPGQPAEAATPAVVAESIKKSAANTPMNLKDARAALLAEIDAAIARVPAENESLHVELERERAKSFDERAAKKSSMSTKAINAARDAFNALRDSNIAKTAKQIGFVIFDVPGDGKFKVVNTKAKLQEFRKKVDASPGFKAPATKPPVVASETDTGSYTPRNAIDDGEYLNAYELAKLQGKPLRFGVGNEHPNAYTDTSEVEGLIPGFKTFVGRKAGQSKAPWIVIEESTGLSISTNTAGHSSKAAAIAGAKDRMKGHEQAAVEALKRGVSDGKPQSRLEAEWLKWAEEQEGRTIDDDANQEPVKNETPASAPVSGESSHADRDPIKNPEPAAEAPAWHTALPTKGLPLTADQEKGRAGAYAQVPFRIAEDAWDAITKTQRNNGMPMYAYYLPASGRHNGIVRLVPDDQNPPSPWKLLNGEAVRHGSMTKEQGIAKMAGWLRSAPVLGDEKAPAESSPETSNPLNTESIFTGLAARGLAKTRAKQAAESHPQAEQIAYVQENFHDILIQLMESGKLEVNGAKTVTEDNKSCL